MTMLQSTKLFFSKNKSHDSNANIELCSNLRVWCRDGLKYRRGNKKTGKLHEDYSNNWQNLTMLQSTKLFSSKNKSHHSKANIEFCSNLRV